MVIKLLDALGFCYTCGTKHIFTNGEFVVSMDSVNKALCLFCAKSAVKDAKELGYIIRAPITVSDNDKKLLGLME